VTIWPSIDALCRRSGQSQVHNKLLLTDSDPFNKMQTIQVVNVALSRLSCHTIVTYSIT